MYKTKVWRDAISLNDFFDDDDKRIIAQKSVNSKLSII